MLLHKNTPRFKNLLSLTLPAFAGLSFLQANPSQIYSFDQKAQPLSDALEAYSVTTGIEVLAPTSLVKGQVATPLDGRLTARAALDALMAESGLEYRFVSDKSVAIRDTSPISDAVPIEIVEEGQDSTLVLEETVVVGQKIERTTFENAESISVIDSAKLAEQPFQNLNGLFRELSNVTPIGDGDTFSIRGIGAVGGLGTVAFVVDGVEIPSEAIFLYPKSLWDVEQVEALRGPQSSNIGRNALGGAIVVKTKDPEFINSSAFRAEYGSEDALQGSLMLNASPNEMNAFRFTLDYEEDDGFVTAPNRNGEDHNAQSQFTSRLKWLFQPNEKFDSLLTLQYAERERGSSLVWNDPDNGFSPFSQLNLSNRPNTQEADFLTLNLDLNYHFNEEWTLLSRSTFADADIRTLVDSDFNASDPTNGIDPFLDNNVEHRDYTQEFRLNYENEDSGTKAVFGVFYEKNKSDLNSISNTALDTTALGIPQALIDAGVYPGIISVDQDSSLESDIDNYAIFFELEKRFAEKWTLFGGLRYDYEEQRHDTRSAAAAADNTPVLAFGGLADEPYLPDPAIFGGVINPADPAAGAAQLSFINNQIRANGAPTETRNVKTSFDALLPHFGLSYDWTGSHRSSAFFKQSYRPGGVQQLVSGRNEFDEELLTSFEISHRARFLDDALTLNANLFFNIWDDRQILESTGIETRVLNAGKSEQYGLELELKHQLNEKWSYFVNFGYLNTEFTEFVNNGVDLKGNEFTFAPEFTGAVGVTYRFLPEWAIHLNTTYQSETYRNLSNTTENDDQFLVNAQLSYQKENFAVTLSAENLFDQEYLTDNRGEGDVARVGNPLTWRLSVSTEF